jgi:hypothetical protein
MIGDLAEDAEDIRDLFQPALSVRNMFHGFVINAIPWSMFFIP